MCGKKWWICLLIILSAKVFFSAFELSSASPISPIFRLDVTLIDYLIWHLSFSFGISISLHCPFEVDQPPEELIKWVFLHYTVPAVPTVGDTTSWNTWNISSTHRLNFSAWKAMLGTISADVCNRWRNYVSQNCFIYFTFLCKREAPRSIAVQKHNVHLNVSTEYFLQHEIINTSYASVIKLCVGSTWLCVYLPLISGAHSFYYLCR